MVDIDHLSASSVNLYLRCPEAWRRKYVLGEVEPPSEAMACGLSVHSFLESVVSAGVDLGVEWTRDEWHHRAPQPASAVERALRDHVVATWGEPLASEAEVGVTRKGYRIVGRIDAVCRDERDPWQIVVHELKTTHGVPRSGHALWRAHKLQLALYAHMLQTPHVSVVCVSHDTHDLVESRYTVRAAHIARALATVDRVWDRVHHGTYPPRPAAWKCRTCWYAPTCAHRGGA